MMKKKERCIFFALLFSVFLIICFEIYLRVFDYDRLCIHRAIEYIVDPVIGHRYLPDTLFIHTNSVGSRLCRTNAHGFPSNNFNKKSEGIYRIIIVGTSDDMNFFSNGPYDYIQYLNEKFKNYPIEIINCSTDGGGRSATNIELILKECIDYEPDLILYSNTDFPLVYGKVYRETYKGYALFANNVSQIESFKKYINEFEMRKKRNIWFILYNSYIFRYYIKIYIDAVKDNNHIFFVSMSQKVIGLNNLNDLRLFARRDIWLPSENEFDIWLSDYDSKWEIQQSIIKNPPFKNIGCFSSGTKNKNWVEVEITEFLKDLIINKKSIANLVLSIKPGSNHFFEFKSELSDLNSPKLSIQDDSIEYYLQPREVSDFKNCFSDLDKDAKNTIKIRHEYKESINQTYGLIKFDISEVKSFKRAILKLYVTDLNFGEEIDEIKYSLNESLVILKNLQHYLEEKNIDFYVYDIYNYTGLRGMADLFADSKIQFFPLDIDGKESFYFGKTDGHSKQEAHKIISEVMFEKLKKEIIPKKYLIEIEDISDIGNNIDER